MSFEKEIIERIFSVGKKNAFTEVALEVFDFQYTRNAVYRQFCTLLNRTPGHVREMQDIPFLPVELFKSKRITSFDGKEEMVFTSSTTTGSTPSSHYIKSLAVYEESFMRSFRIFYGEPSEYCILSLLPGYLERTGSSLVYMAKRLMEESGHPRGGFYLDKLHDLAKVLDELVAKGERVMLLGVSFALLELAEKFPMPLPGVVIVETGGMKGRRDEITRKELHEVLCGAFGQEYIHSEYGMTELLSQAYSKGNGRFVCPPWMRVLIRDGNDPLSYMPKGRSGGVNIIDLANLYSCSFLATQDLGSMHGDGMFEISGRFDHADIRGCNLMFSDELGH